MAGNFGLKEYVTGASVIAADVDIINDDKIKLIIQNAGPTNEIVLYGRIAGQYNWDIIGSVIGSNTEVFIVSLFDFVRVECLTFDSLGGRVDIIGSGFSLTAGVPTVTTPNGEIYDVNHLVFTSSNDTIIITAIDPGTIDIKTAGDLETTKYIRNILLTDWIGPSANEYSLSIPFAFHAIVNPTVKCYELSGTDYNELLVPITVDASNNIRLNVSTDARFVGKLVII